MFGKNKKVQHDTDTLPIPKGSQEPGGDYTPPQYKAAATATRLLLLSMVANLGLVGVVLMQSTAFKPVVQLVDVASGNIVVPTYDQTFQVGGAVVDALEIKAKAKAFIQERYAYTPLTLESHLTAALNMMDPAARAKEQDAIRANQIAEYIINNDASYTITLDEASWEIAPAADRVVSVAVNGTVSITNATVYRDRPFSKPVRFTLQLRKDAGTETNLSGYVILVPSKDIL
jgi:hypothetical protein